MADLSSHFVDCFTLMHMLLRPATADDLPAILALEQLDESRKYVGQWSLERHRDTLASDDARYFVSQADDTTLSAYAILRGLAESSGSIELKRVVVHPPGKGLGKRILNELLYIAFEELAAHRVFLDVFDDNHRAQHLYQSLGFKQEGVLRDAAIRDGVYHSLLLMSILESEYAEQNRR